MPTEISPNMNMPIPVVSEDPGPDWAENVNECLTVVDGHTHTPGQGVPITSEAIDINADLPLNGNNLITVRSSRYDSQNSPLAEADDLNCVYVSEGELFYNDADGNQVQLTESGAPAGATGTITGLPSGTASASFSGTTFNWRSSTNTPASMNQGPTKIRQAVANGFGITLTANGSQASDYVLTMPIALPSVPGFFSSDTSGNMSFVPLGANVRSAASGTTTLTSSDNPWQIFNTNGASTCVLPSVGITSGQCFTIENVGTSGSLEVQSSNTNVLCYVNSLYSSVKLIALQATPTSLAHWKVDFAYTEKNYYNGTTYNGGIDPAVTTNRASTSVKKAVFIPYQMQDGVWRLKFNLTLEYSPASSVLISVVGITSKNTTDYYQSFVYGDSQGDLKVAQIDPNTANFQCQTNVTAGRAILSGDIELDSKPTWAY